MEKQYLNLFKKLIRLKTTHDPENRKEHDHCRELLIAEADKRGLNTKIIPSEPYPSLLMGTDVDRTDPPLLLSAHLDVVPGGKEMFEPKIEGDKLIGRGASDMKFAIPVFFNVLDRLKTGKRKILLAFTFDEEIGGQHGMRYLLEDAGLRPKVGFIPDGGDNFCIVAYEKGVFMFRVKTYGKATHISRPWLGKNAIDEMLSIYSDLRNEFPVVNSAKQWTQTLSMSKIKAGDAVNKVPDLCEASFDLRFVEGRTKEEIIDLITQIIGNRGDMKSLVVGDNFFLDPDNYFCKLFQETVRRHLSSPLPIYQSEGASDARFFTKHAIPVIITKPRCKGHHSEYEWIDLQSLEPYTDILFDFAKRVIAEEE
ncbi:M20/M25/M40 family metallo-hydrolase [Desulfococcaceae bacterium HSG9]|nr:M20/M25/M40 family metallo-hydrolase [Desulfococcaceae bacterium HSG9]